MNMKRIRILLFSALLIFSTLLSSCQSDEKVTEYPITLKQVLTEANERNHSVIDNFKIDNISDYYFDVDMDGFTEDELEKLFTPGYMTGVKPAKAKEDIDVLFRILEGSYAGYAYFGGAPAFDQAKADMLSEIETYGDKNISAADFAKLIRNHLGFVIDNHLVIGSLPLGLEEAYCWYDNNNYEYHRDSNGYYTLIKDAKWYLSEDMINYLKYTIGASGEIVYGLFFIGTDAEKDQLPEQLTLTRKNEEKVVTIIWEKVPPQSRPSKEYELRDTDGFKTAVISAFYNTQNTNTMINDAKELSKEDYTIIDLRYNTGGLSPDVLMWMYNFTNKEIFPKGTALSYAGVVNDYWHGLMKTEVLEVYNTFDFAVENPQVFNHLVNSESDVYTVTNVDNGIKRIDYDTQWTQRDGKVLFLLNGKENVSCGELFIETCKSLENTLIVGTNSGGCLTTGDVNSSNVLYLPNSQIGIFYSAGLMFYESYKDFDKYGIMPDIYIGTGDEAEAVARCIRYYQESTEE
jgi:hypothetical protein